jgi:hypothetical protein
MASQKLFILFVVTIFLSLHVPHVRRNNIKIAHLHYEAFDASIVIRSFYEFVIYTFFMRFSFYATISQSSTILTSKISDRLGLRAKASIS